MSFRQISKISYVLPISKEQTKSSIKTNDPENYHHLHVLKDYAVKDKSNYYDKVMPLNGPQEVESEHYGNLTENGAYLTVTKSLIDSYKSICHQSFRAYVPRSRGSD